MAQAVAESALSALLEIEDEAARQSAAVWLRQQLAGARAAVLLILNTGPLAPCPIQASTLSARERARDREGERARKRGEGEQQALAAAANLPFQAKIKRERESRERDVVGREVRSALTLLNHQLSNNAFSFVSLPPPPPSASLHISLSLWVFSFFFLCCSCGVPFLFGVFGSYAVNDRMDGCMPTSSYHLPVLLSWTSSSLPLLPSLHLTLCIVKAR